MGALLSAYLAFSHVSDPIWRNALNKRVARGKMDAARLEERFARDLPASPDGEVLWFHALSVGESLALLPLIKRAGALRPDLSFVLTTTTITSAQALAKVGLPPRCLHQYLPVDTHMAVNCFLDHWEPVAGVFSEMDFWPAIMVAANKRDIPLALINSRFYENSVQSRGKLKGLYRDILRLFQICLVQDAGSARHFADFGVDPARIQVCGALKGAAQPLPCDPRELAELKTAIGARPVWLAAATHAAEHAAMLRAHSELLKHKPDALLIIAPRNISEGAAIAKAAEDRFDGVALRSAGQDITASTCVYIADTMGEMGLWYRLAPVSFIGYSLVVPEVLLKGKNPFEAAALGSAILHGPRIEDFAETYASLDRAGAAIEIAQADDLAPQVSCALEPNENKRLSAAAHGVIQAQQQVLDVTWQAIAEILPKAADKA